MTQTKRRSIALIALVVLAAVGAGFAGVAAAAFSSYSITPTDDRAGITTTHEHSITAGASGTVEDVVITYAQSDVSDVAASDVTVTYNGGSQTVASVTSTDANTLRVTLGSTVSIASADTVTVTVDGVANPDTSGDYTVNGDLQDTSDTSVDSGTATLTIANGPAPGVTSASTLDEGVTVQNFTASAANSSDLVLETGDDPFTATFTDVDGEDTYLTLDENSDVLEDATADDGVVTLNVTHDLLQDVPIEAGGSTDVMVTLTNESADAAENSFTFTLDAPTDSARTVKFVGNSFGDSVDVEDFELKNGTYTILDYSFDWGKTKAAFTQQDVTVGNGSTTTFAYGNATASEAATTSVDGIDAGNWVQSTVIIASTDDSVEPIRVYADEAPDDLDADETYAVQDSDTGRTTIYWGDDIDAESADVTISNNFGFWTQFDGYGTAVFDSPLGIGLGSLSGLSLGALVLFGRPDPEGQ